MSFGKNLFVFVSGAVVGAGALAGFAGWKMYKALKKNDILYTAVRSSVDAGVKAASSEFSEHGAKAVLNMVFGWPEKHNKISYEDHHSKFWETCDFNINQVSFDSRKEAANVLHRLADILDQYGTVTVADFYDEAGLNDHDPYYSNSHYGWKDIGDAYVVKVRSGWSISLPDPIKLE
jgi:hypothetical protein